MQGLESTLSGLECVVLFLVLVLAFHQPAQDVKWVDVALLVPFLDPYCNTAPNI